jgi:hypothetical protein
MITVRPAKTKEEYEDACKFIESIYREHNYVEFLKSNPSQLLIAAKEKEGVASICGAIGIILESETLLPTEQYFNFDFGKLVPNLDRNKIFEISRLTSKGMSPLAPLLIAVGKYAEQFGFDYALACVKPKLLHFLRDVLSIPAQIVDVKVCPDKIPGEYSGYFLKSPTPIVIYFVVAEVMDQLRFLERKLIGSAKPLNESNPNFDKQTVYNELLILGNKPT